MPSTRTLLAEAKSTLKKAREHLRNGEPKLALATIILDEKWPDHMIAQSLKPQRTRRRTKATATA